MLFLWIKVLHILAVISWMAGLFYLPRLFVYHAMEPSGSATGDTFKVMERRLIKAIMRPAAVVTFISGPWLTWQMGYGFLDFWLVMKYLGVAGMLGVHLVLEHHVAAFRDGRPTPGHRFFRVLNEIPTVLLIWIVIWVVVKPW
jgi:putative membrane protein